MFSTHYTQGRNCKNQGLETGPVDMRNGGSWSGSQLGAQHSHGGWKLSAAPVPGDPIPAQP